MLLSETQTGLKWVLHILAKHCQEERLEINYFKTKVMVFAKHPKANVRWLNNHPMEQDF